MKVLQKLFFALALLMMGTANGGPVTPERAAVVARNFFNVLSATKESPQLTPVSQWQYDGIYLFTVKDGGFVLVAADDGARPILGYSPDGIMDPADLPAALQSWLQGYQQVITLLRGAKGCPVHPGWYALEHNLVPKDGDTSGVAPLITTFWDQTYPYNAYCPGGSAVGCAATAQAQVMNYWKFPAFGLGSHSYSHNRYGVQSADFAHTLYDWDHMPVMATYNSPMEEKEAVATLMYHCGVSLDMDYDPSGSAASGLSGIEGLPSIDNSLKDYFGYSSSMRVVRRDFYTKDQWRDLLIAELDLRHPIVYVGSGDAGGHGFVCDGYDSRGYLHFNFGWSRRGDGYFPVDSISPGVGGVGGNETYTFNQFNAALLGLVPDYRLMVSDTLFSISRIGGEDSLLFAPNSSIYSMWHIACDADWVTLHIDTFLHACRVHFTVDENNSGHDRYALVNFFQGDERRVVRIAQGMYDDSELCPLTVVMENTHGGGWQGGAQLTFEAPSGYLYGSAQLMDGDKDSVVVRVAPNEVLAVWHPGGGTDRYINYSVVNQYGEVLVSVRYAYRNGGTHRIVQPCEQNPSVGIDTPATGDAVTLYPNPVSDVLNVQAAGLQKVEVMDMSGRILLTAQCPSIDFSRLPAGAYFVRVITDSTTTVKRIIKN